MAGCPRGPGPGEIEAIPPSRTRRISSHATLAELQGVTAQGYRSVVTPPRADAPRNHGKSSGASDQAEPPWNATAARLFA